MDNYLITINGFQQTVGDTESDNVELITSGDFEYENGLYYIDYDESGATGLEGCHTSIEIGADYLSIQRTGAINTDMLYIEGKKTYSLYNTPYGQMMIGIYTKKLNIDIDDTGGDISIEYTIEMNDKPCGSNRLKITVKKSN